MSNRTMYATAPRRWWPWVAALVGAAVVAGGVVLLTNGSDSSSATEPPPASDSPTSAAPAQGCLGTGAESPGDAVLAAQQLSPITGDGAAGFLAAVYRWGAVLPSVPQELELIGPQILTDDFPARDRAQLEQDLTEGPGQATTFEGHRYDVMAFDGTSATVALTVGLLEGNLETGQGLMIGRLVVVDGKWRWAGFDDRAFDPAFTAENAREERERIDTEGTEFVEAC